MRNLNENTLFRFFIDFRFRSIVLSYERLHPEFHVDVDSELEKYVLNRTLHK